MSGFVARIEAALLLALGGGGLWLAMDPLYVRLMNPAFRWVTAAGMVLILAMGGALLLRPRAHPRPGAAVIFALLGVLVAVSRPLAGESSLLVVPEVDLSGAAREGYSVIDVQELVDPRPGTVPVVAGAPVAVTGFVHRTEELERDGRFLLLHPVMACCVADAIAYGIQVGFGSGGPRVEIPPSGEWVTVLAELRAFDAPVDLPPIRVGSIVFVVLGRTHDLVATEVVPVRSTLDDLVDMIPGERCSAFLRALVSTGVDRELREAGPFTLFCPIDASFEDQAPSDPEALRRYVRGFAVAQDLRRVDLFSHSTLDALSGETIDVEAENGRARLNGARMLFEDVRARNGMLHIVHPAWAPTEPGR